MTVRPHHRSAEDERQEEILLMVFGAAGVVLSGFALLVGWALSPLVWRSRWHWAFAAAAGLGLTALLWPEISRELSAGWQAFANHRGQVTDKVSVAWPHIRSWWLWTLGLTPAYALIADRITPTRVEQLRERRARRGVGIERPSRREPRFELGRHVSGDRLLPTRFGRVRLPLERLRRTVLVVGAPGSGKTETLLRLAYGAASSTDWCVFVLDAKGDQRTQERFAALMRSAGRTPRLFPQEPYDGWRGTARETTNRLVGLIDWAQEGGGAYYRDLQTNIVRLACTAPEGPPRCSEELLRRLERSYLASLWAGTPEAGRILASKPEHVDSARQRYQSFFDASSGQLDGDFALEDSDCAYLLLNELVYGEETGKLARFLVEDFKQYVASRKQQGQQVLLIVDEFSAIADGERMARVVEVVRSYGAALVLAPQAFEGMGGEEASARILNAAHTIFLHQVPEPEQLASAAGTKLAIEQSLQHDAGRSTEIGSAREQHQHKVPPNEVRQVPPGMCFVIGSGRAQKVQVAPTGAGE